MVKAFNLNKNERIGLAQSNFVAVSSLVELLCDDDEDVVCSALSNSKMPNLALKKFLDKNTKYRVAIASNQNISLELVNILKKDSTAEVVEALSKNKAIIKKD